MAKHKALKIVLVTALIAGTLITTPVFASDRNIIRDPSHPANEENYVAETVLSPNKHDPRVKIGEIVYKIYDNHVPNGKNCYLYKTVYRDSEVQKFTGHKKLDKAINELILKDALTDVWYDYAVESIYSINGVPIEDTKYAYMGGNIHHIADRLNELSKEPEDRKIPNVTAIEEINTYREVLGLPKKDMTEEAAAEEMRNFLRNPIEFEGIKIKEAAQNQNNENINLVANKDLSVEVNGLKLELDVVPYIKNGRTMIPFRAIFEALGAEVDYDFNNQNERKVWGIKGENKVDMIIGSPKALRNNKEVYMDTIPEIKDGRTFIPVRYASEWLGAKVDWNDETKTVLINTENKKTEEVKKEKVKQQETKKEEIKEPAYKKSCKTLEEAGIAYMNKIDELESIDGTKYEKVYKMTKKDFPFEVDGVVITDIRIGGSPFKKHKNVILLSGYVKDREEGIANGTFNIACTDNKNNFRVRNGGIAADEWTFNKYKSMYPNLPLKMLSDYNKGLIDIDTKQGEKFTYIFTVQDDLDDLRGFKDAMTFSLKDVKNIILYNSIDGTELFVFDKNELK
ncbi:copper amine oxidase N-terminal domain-containing protein [Crassaminicella indica]|uniref:Copper amine oxidase N-terminal domain-containing protein n=1 Tax=Crassaminicella indica TaxID=2855394 RepID=A0ABX8RCY5_9CLOT|nr:copper amine oxidase N-terminal domain-containing protein [Crassaminicella indica]QXM05590.1 copper amine oxidase N-terminal domain-containing protein [Crassaminicella indica]